MLGQRVKEIDDTFGVRGHVCRVVVVLANEGEAIGAGAKTPPYRALWLSPSKEHASPVSLRCPIRARCPTRGSLLDRSTDPAHSVQVPLRPTRAAVVESYRAPARARFPHAAGPRRRPRGPRARSDRDTRYAVLAGTRCVGE